MHLSIYFSLDDKNRFKKKKKKDLLSMAVLPLFSARQPSYVEEEGKSAFLFSARPSIFPILDRLGNEVKFREHFRSVDSRIKEYASKYFVNLASNTKN